MTQRGNTGHRGFTLIEMIVVLAGVMIILAMAIVQFQNFLPTFRADAAMNQVVREFRVARQSSVSDRRNVTINFIMPNQIQLLQVPQGGGAPVLVSNVFLEGGAQFVLFGGVPDTPMGFGTSGPIALTGGVSGDQFLNDGSFGTNVGLPINGTIFIGMPGKSYSARAVTILGSTGRARAYRWNGSTWLE